MDVLEKIKLKRTFLYSLIISISISALIGIWVILLGSFGWFETRILSTTLIIVGTSILGLACGAYLENPRSHQSKLRLIPILGIIFSFIAAIIGLRLTWFSTDNLDGFDVIYKVLAVSIIFAFSLAHLSLLSLAKLSPKFQWALIVAYVSILALATILSAIIVFNSDSDEYFIWRTVGVLTVVDAAITVMIPVFHRLSHADFPENREYSIERIDAEIEKLKQQISDLEQEKWKISNFDNEPQA